jgi:hypothetical protein
VNKFVKRCLVIIFITIISALIVIPFLWVISVYIDIYPDSDQVVLIKPSIFRVADIIPKFEDLVPARARYCVAIAARIEARTKASLIELNNYYEEKWNKDPDSGHVEYVNFGFSTSTYGIFAFRIIENSHNVVEGYRDYGIRSEIDLCKLDNWYLLE